MLDIMSQAENAIEAYNQALQASSANIANMNVTGYKKISVSFQSVFEKVLSRGTAATTTMGGTNPEQLGQGMSISQTSIDFSNAQTTAGGSLDLAVQGNGLFLISPDGGNTFLYTRAGNFSIDANGNLTSNNLQVYGLDGSGNVVPISNLPSGNKSNYQWLQDGTLQYTTDSTASPINWINTGYTIALTYFANPSRPGPGAGDLVSRKPWLPAPRRQPRGRAEPSARSCQDRPSNPTSFSSGNRSCRSTSSARSAPT